MSKDAATPDDLAAACPDLSVSYHRVLCALDRELQAGHGLTSSEFEVLELLWAASDHKRRMSDLADNVHLSQSALSRVVARLEKDGLVERSMCANDRRSVFAELTAEGETRYCAARPTQRAILADLSGGCPQMIRAAASGQRLTSG